MWAQAGLAPACFVTSIICLISDSMSLYSLWLTDCSIVVNLIVYCFNCHYILALFVVGLLSGKFFSTAFC